MLPPMMPSRPSLRTFACLAALLAAAPIARAQEIADLDAGNGRTRRTETTTSAPLVLRTPEATIRLGGQIVFGAAGPLGERSDTDLFRIAAARASVRATLGGRYGLFLRTDLSRTPALLDAELSARVSPALRVDAGRFKTPFSYELLSSRAGLDFADRSRVVRALAPNRRTGVEATLSILPREALTVTAGVFDGRGLGADGSGDDGSTGARLVAARVQAHMPPALARATGLRGTAGVNIAHEGPDAFVRTGIGAARTLVGADARLRLGRVVVAGEWIGETLRRATDATGTRVAADGRSGYYATAAVDLTPDHRALVRLDRFEGASEVIGGLNVSLTPAVTAQVNAIVPAAGFAPGERRARLAATAQITF